MRERFEQANPTLEAATIAINEARAQEVTAYLRPNPEFSLTTDGTQISPYQGIWQPFAGTMFTTNFSYLHERGKKRELRLESAQGNTAVVDSQRADTRRTLLFSVRNAFVQALQAKAVLATTRENLAYYERVLNVNSDRLKAGDIARVDMDRLELQRVQFETDVRTAEVNVRTAKIQLLGLLNDRTPVDLLDVTGPFEFQEVVLPLSELHDAALASRPDLKAAAQAVEKAKTDYRLAVANSTTDPTFATWYSHNSSFNNPFANNTIGGSIGIPLRIFDKNQGERERTQLDIRRSERLEQAARAQVFADVDSAWVTLNSTAGQLRMYTSKYLQLAETIRETISFSYERGNSSLLEFLQAQNEYRNVRLSYLNLVGAYLTAANQLNTAVGREVIA